jgi:TPR repeat protein
MTVQSGPDLLALPADATAVALAGPPEAAARLIEAGAQAGLPEAQTAFGQMLLEGRGVTRDEAAALGWFRLAARAGDRMAINLIGRCYEKGWGTAPDAVIAAQWYKAAAETGLDWGMYNYGGALGLGSGVARDEAAAFGWFQRAAALGHAKSINVIGAFHEEGRLIPHDLGKAAECYRHAAEGGDFRGQFNHARLLADAGRIDEAVDWIKTANRTCTDAFRAVMHGWLRDRADPRLSGLATALGLAAIPR